MTPEEQRIKIAEACGHKFEKFMCNPPRLINPAIQLSEIPDYLNDLNAMHEAEKRALVVYKDWGEVARLS